MIENDSSNPGEDHAIVIVKVETNPDRIKIKDPDHDYFEWKTFSDVYIYRHFTITITSEDCFAKITPGIFSSLSSTVMNYSWNSNEWACINGTTTGNVYMKSSKQVHGVESNAEINAYVYFNNVSNAKLYDVTVKKKIAFTNGGWNWLNNVTFTQDDNQIGIDMSNSDPSIVNCTSTTTKSSYAFYPHYYSGPNISGLDLTHKSYGIRVGNYSFVTVSSSDFCQNTWDVYAEGSAYDSDVYDSIVFSADDPEECIYGDVNLPDLEDWEYCGLSKSIPSGYAKNLSDLNLNMSIPETEDNYRQGLYIYNNIRRQVQMLVMAKENVDIQEYLSDFDLAIQYFMNYIENNPNTGKAVQAFNLIKTCYLVSERANIAIDFLDRILANPESNLLHPYAKSMLIPCYLDLDNPVKALKLCDELLEIKPELDISVELLYMKGLIYRFSFDDPDQAADIFLTLIEQYPDHSTAFSAKDQLEQLGEKILDTSNNQNEEFTVQNFPNPFNPTTSIKFTLPENGYVILKIYDIRGREVITLIDAERQAGAHNIVWNSRDKSGTQAASGMYFYRIQYKGQVLTNKMILMR